MPDASFPDLPALATHLRTEPQTKKFVLLDADNGSGKTRLPVGSSIAIRSTQRCYRNMRNRTP